jgi:hypothetical protein
MVATILDFSLLAECGATRVFAALTVCGSHHALESAPLRSNAMIKTP